MAVLKESKSCFSPPQIRKSVWNDVKSFAVSSQGCFPLPSVLFYTEETNENDEPKPVIPPRPSKDLILIRCSETTKKKIQWGRNGGIYRSVFATITKKNLSYSQRIVWGSLFLEEFLQTMSSDPFAALVFREYDPFFCLINLTEKCLEHRIIAHGYYNSTVII